LPGDPTQSNKSARVDGRRRLREWFDEKARAGAMRPSTVGYRSPRAWAGVHSALRAILPMIDGLRILDVGCGHGMMLAPWARSSQVVGVDVAWSMLPLARSVGLQPVQGDGAALPFRPASFDVVVSVELLQHVEDVEDFIAGLAQQVRPGGVVIVGAPNAASVLRRLAGAVTRWGLVARDAPPDLPRLRLRSIETVANAGVRAGLLPERLAVSYFPLAVGRRLPRVGTVHALLVSNFLVGFRRPTRG
jgi:2-polyprenyl-3-methyl-5-hydroxy-6-metoxy-1,4-benzoquinol methylase